MDKMASFFNVTRILIKPISTKKNLNPQFLQHHKTRYIEVLHTHTHTELGKEAINIQQITASLALKIRK